jgi:hypothetical protein
MKEVDMVGACSMHIKRNHEYKFLAQTLKGTDNLGDLRIDGRLILKLILNNA